MMRRDMSDILTIEDREDEDYVELTALQMASRNIRNLLREDKSKLSLEQLESAYLNKYGTPLKPEDYGFNSTSSLLTAIPDTVDVRGRESRKLVSLHTNRLLESSTKHSFQRLKRQTQPSPSLSARMSSQSATVSFSGRGFDMIRSLAPPKTSANSGEYSFQNASSDSNNNLSGSVLRSQHVPYILSPTPLPSHDINKPSTGIDFWASASSNGSNNFSSSPPYQIPQHFHPCGQLPTSFLSHNLYRHSSPPAPPTGIYSSPPALPNGIYSSPPAPPTGIYSSPTALPTGIYSSPPVPFTGMYSNPPVPPAGIYYPNHGNSVWGSPAEGSPIAGQTFQQHIMRHSPSPLITQTPYHIQSSSVGGQRTRMLPPVPGSPCLLVSNLEPPTARVRKVPSLLGCEAEIDRNLAKLTESIANQVLLETSPRPVTPNSPVCLPRTGTPDSRCPTLQVVCPEERLQICSQCVELFLFEPCVLQRILK